jgi:arylsulfatase A-like enzyme
MISWPGQIEPGISRTPVSNVDFYPTFAAIIGSKKMPTRLDGVDLSSLLLDGRAIADRALYWHFPIYLQAYSEASDQGRDPLFRTRPGSVIRKGKWKLHHYFEDDSYELYNLESDLPEHVDLAPYLPELVAELREMLDAWRSEIGAPVPTRLNPEYNAQFEHDLIVKALKK